MSRLNRAILWRENDRLRADASRILVDAALATGVTVYVQPTVHLRLSPRPPRLRGHAPGGCLPDPEICPRGRARDRSVRPRWRGIVLRFGLLDGPGTGNDQPVPALGATLHVIDAARALLGSLTLPSGIYNVCRDNERVSNRRFSEAASWHPVH
jgi:hypothetical protein